MLKGSKPPIKKSQFAFHPNKELTNTPSGIVIHAMSSKFPQSALKYSRMYNSNTNTVGNIHLSRLDVDVDASEFLYYMGLSAHAFGHPNGLLELGQAEHKKAYHAGTSTWDGKHHLNSHYLGYELLIDLDEYKYPEQSGYNDDYSKLLYVMRTYDWLQAPQFDALVWQCVEWCRKYNIHIKNVVGHSQVSPGRKHDPGVMFPYDLLYKYLKKYDI